MVTNGQSSERRVVTALFCDVVGSTTIAETMDPEDWRELVGETIDCMADAVERYGGTVAQFAGDGILALFGAPVAHEDDPYRAVRAAMSIIESVRASGSLLDVRVGINTGLVIAGDIDAGDLNLYSALGDATNVAARLQSLAEPGHVVVSGETLALLGDDVEVREIGPTELKGRIEAVEVYDVISVRGSEERTRGIAGLSSPMVGRDTELEQLIAMLETGAAGSGRVAAILGEPGVGKSRLIAELCDHIRTTYEVDPAVGICVPYDEKIPYHLVASLVLSMAGVTPTSDHTVIRKAVGELAERAGQSDATETLLQLLGIAEAPSTEDPAAARARYLEAVKSVKAGVAVSQPPLVLICEDTHWADPSSVEFVSELLELAPSLPLVVVIAMRPDRASEGWRLLATARSQLGEQLVEVHLTPLDTAMSGEIVANLLEIESLPMRLRSMILEKAEGNPFFLEEVVRMLIERDAVTYSEGRWIAKGTIDGIDVPATLHGLLASRIDLLPSPVRRAGRVAAVIGRQFSTGLFDVVHPSDDGDGTTVHPHIAALEGHGMIRLAVTHPTIEFEFRHALIHDVMYEGLLRKERREIHQQVADAIERMHADDLDQHASALARHHANAGNTEAAINYLMSAGRVAEGRGARAEAHGFYTDAQLLADVDADAATWLDAAIGRARSGATFTPRPDALALIEEALAVATDLDDANRQAALYIELLTVRNMSGESYATQPYRDQLDAAYALVPRIDDPGLRALLHGMMGLAHRGADEFAKAIAELESAWQGLETAGRLAAASLHASFLADSHSHLGNFSEAEAAIAEAARLGAASGDPNAILDADLIKGRIASDRGELAEGLEHARRGLEAAEAVGNTFCSLAGNFLVADHHMRLGDTEAAIDHLERSTGLAEYCHAGGYEALGEAWLTAARARIDQADVSDFDAPLEKAMAAKSRSGEGLVRLHRAVTLAADGRANEAFDDFEKAVRLFESYGGLPNLARTHNAYGQVLEAAGFTDTAAEHLRTADELFTRLGITPDPVPG